MNKLASPDDLKNYALRRLGSPVINIEIDDTQIDDRIDDAIQLFVERHFDGVDEVYLKHTVTDRDAARGYIIVKDDIVAITELYSIGDAGSGSEELSRLNYHIAQSDIVDFLGSANTTVEYYLTRQHIDLINQIFTPRRSFSFNSISHKFDPVDALKAGNIVVYRAYQALDVDLYEDIYNNMWMKKYVTALIKRQWGENTKKFDGVQLPGGVTVSGQTIWSEADAEITKLEEEFANTYELPVNFFIA